MFEKILVPIDGSEISKKAVSKAVEMAKELGSTIVVANIMNQKNSFSFDMQDDESRDFVSAMVDYIKGEDVAVESMILFGSPEFDIEKVARKSEADVMLKKVLMILLEVLLKLQLDMLNFQLFL